MVEIDDAFRFGGEVGEAGESGGGLGVALEEGGEGGEAGGGLGEEMASGHEVLRMANAAFAACPTRAQAEAFVTRADRLKPVTQAALFDCDGFI